MKINHTDVPAIFSQFMDADVAPQATGMQKFGAYAAAFIVQSRMPQIMEQYGPIMKMAGVLGNDGMIDLEMAYNMAKFAMDKAGKVNVAGYLADSSDIEQLYAIAKSYGR